MASLYPGSLDNFAINWNNDSDADANSVGNVGDHARMHNDYADALNKIEAELGTNPSKSIASLSAFLDVGHNSDGTTKDAAPLGQSGQTPSQEPVAPGTANVGSLSVAARADHIHPSSGLYGWLGTGADGSAVFDGAATPAGSTKIDATHYRLVRDVHYTDMSVSAGVEVQTGGWKVHVRGTLTGPASGAGTIIGKPAEPTGTNEATRGYQHYPGTSATRRGSLGVGWRGIDGGTGAGGATGECNPDGGVLSIGGDQGVEGKGGNGGAGSNGAGGTAFSGVTNTGFPSARTRFEVATTGIATGIDQANLYSGSSVGSVKLSMGGWPGAPGGGDGTNAGGAGGVGGHVVVVNAKKVTGNLNVTAPGGRGGSPTVGNCGGGGGGGGGVVWLNSLDLSEWTGAVSAPVGAGGTPSGTGVAGSNGAVAGFAQATEWK